MLPRPIIAALRGVALVAETIAESVHETDRPYHETRAEMLAGMPEQDFSNVLLRLSTDKHSFISAVIRWRTDFECSHAEFWFPKTEWTLGSRFPDGVQWREPKSTANQRAVILATFDGIGRAAKWVADNRIGYRYDTLGIFGIASARDWHNKKERFCSETIAEGAEMVAAPLINKAMPVSQITPRDLMVPPAPHVISFAE